MHRCLPVCPVSYLFVRFFLTLMQLLGCVLEVTHQMAALSMNTASVRSGPCLRAHALMLCNTSSLLI